MSSRRIGDKEKYLLGISLSNKCKCVSDKYMFQKSNLCLTNLRQIQNTLIRTQ